MQATHDTPYSQGLLQTISSFLEKVFHYPYLYSFFALICLNTRTLLNTDSLLASILHVPSFPLFKVLTYFIFAAVFLCYAVRWINGTIKRCNPTLLCIVGMFLFLSLVTFLFNGASGYHPHWHAGFALMLIFDMGLQCERKSLIRGLAGAYEFWVYLNLFSFIIFPSSFSPRASVKDWILDSHVFYYRIVFPAFSLALIRHHLLGSKKDWRMLLLASACLLTVYHQQGATALIGIAVFLALLIWYNRRAMPRFTTPLVFTAVSILIFISIQYFNLLNLFESIIVKDLGKNISLSGRTRIWDKTLSILFKNPVTGVGYLPVAYMRDLFWQWAPHTHNQILELLLHGGFVTLIFYFAALFFSSREAVRHRRNPAVKALSFLLCTFSLMGVVEIFHNDPMYYALFVFLSRADCLTQDVKQLPRISMLTRIKRDIGKVKKRPARNETF